MRKKIIEIRKHETINKDIYYDIVFMKNNDINFVLTIPQSYISNDVLEVLNVLTEKELNNDVKNMLTEVILKYLDKKVGE